MIKHNDITSTDWSSELNFNFYTGVQNMSSSTKVENWKQKLY